jgi:hypothetical protein
VVLTDEQTGPGNYWGHPTVDQAIPDAVPLYTWNLAGYSHGHAPAGHRNRHTFAGLTDRHFGTIPLVEAGMAQDWPWVPVLAATA